MSWASEVLCANKRSEGMPVGFGAEEAVRISFRERRRNCRMCEIKEIRDKYCD